MKVVYTEDALRDVDAIADWLIIHYPGVAPVVERRIRNVIAQIARWPESARRSTTRPNVRVTSLGRYPYKIRWTLSPMKALRSWRRITLAATTSTEGWSG